ncbi:hypothetical protein ACOSQ4_028674 [Xanthoceras sorbifolium]
MNKLLVLDMHVEIPLKDGAPTFYGAGGGGGGGTLIIGAGPNEGPIRGVDYSFFVYNGDKEVVLFDDEDDIANKDAATISSLMNNGIPSVGKNVSESSSQASKDTLMAPDPPAS